MFIDTSWPLYWRDVRVMRWMVMILIKSWHTKDNSVECEMCVVVTIGSGARYWSGSSDISIYSSPPPPQPPFYKSISDLSKYYKYLHLTRSKHKHTRRQNIMDQRRTHYTNTPLTRWSCLRVKLTERGFRGGKLFSAMDLGCGI